MKWSKKMIWLEGGRWLDDGPIPSGPMSTALVGEPIFSTKPLAALYFGRWQGVRM
jgi:hypothetical protein